MGGALAHALVMGSIMDNRSILEMLVEVNNPSPCERQFRIYSAANWAGGSFRPMCAR